MLFDVKRFAINDGPGIRLTLFLKGCPLHCVWCHNPEGIQPCAEKLFNAKKCMGCESCVAVCPRQHDPRQHLECCQCHGCDGDSLPCVEACPTKALEKAGRVWTMDELMAVVEKERDVMEQSGGGVTLCGGEPLMHPAEALAILEELGRRHIHRTVDTTLFASPDVVQRIVARCELLLVDLKHMDSALHRQYTGVPNEQILHNIQLISQMGVPFWIRIPLISGINADEGNMRASARFLASLPHAPEVVNLLPYHDIGKGKHERRGTSYNPDSLPMSTPSAQEQQQVVSLLEAEGLTVRVGG